MHKVNPDLRGREAGEKFGTFVLWKPQPCRSPGISEIAGSGVRWAGDQDAAPWLQNLPLLRLPVWTHSYEDMHASHQ